tara:strand:- start:540 stop:1379 length:840 start_codon:yes stop_codon:yes gene_type:complete
VITIKNFSSLLIAGTLMNFSSLTKATDKKIAYKTDLNISYRSGSNLTKYMKNRCRLDIYYPSNKKEFATVVWFHGGGLKNGNRFIPAALKEKGIAIVAVSYRLHPKVKSPKYVDDAAAAVAWTLKNISSYSGSSKKVFVSGHSAGGYLTSMIGLDKIWLTKYGADPNQLAGLIPYSGHTITHFTVRAERGIESTQPIVDKMAPLYHIRKDCPPFLLITGDRKLELLGRYEENAYFWRMMKVIGHPDSTLMELDGYNHGQMANAAHPILLRFINRILKEQ